MINATNKTPILTDRNKIAENNLFEALTHQKDKNKPEAPKGYLLERKNVFKNIAQDAAYFGKDVKNAGKAIVTGKSNDHAIGKINDLGMKIGALAIASYLTLKRGTAKQKAMEFIGGGAFLTTMALWPKLTVAKPLEKKFGFDIQQDYVDSQGRRKKFFGDNQYLPWDLWSKEKINKVADHMGIPKDLPDREEFTKRKMQKVALQGNTWILLSSGFATPLITALVCRAAESPIEKFLIDRNIKKAAGKVANMDATVNSMLQNGVFDNFNKQDFLKAIESFKDRKIDETSLQEITKFVDPVQEIAKDKNLSIHLLPADLNGSTNSLARQIFDSLPDTYTEKALDKMKGILSEERFGELTKYVEEQKTRIGGDIPASKLNLKMIDLLKQQGIGTKERKAIQQEIGLAEETVGIFDKLLKALKMDKASGGVQNFYDLQKPKRAEVRVMTNLADAIAGKHKESLYTQVGEEFNKEFIRQINPDYKAMKKFKSNTDYANMLHENFEKLATNVGSKRHHGESGALEGTRGTLEYFVKNISTSLKKLDTPYDEYFEKNGEKLIKGHKKTIAIFDDAVDDYARRLASQVRLQKLVKQGEGAKLIIIADAERRLSLLKDNPEALKKAFNVDTDKHLEEVLGATRQYLYTRTALSRNMKNTYTDVISRKAIDFIFKADMDEKVATELTQNGTKEIVDNARGLFYTISRMDGDFSRSFVLQEAINNYMHGDYAKNPERRAAVDEVTKNVVKFFDGNPKDYIDIYHGDSLVNRFKTIVKDNGIGKKWLKAFGIAAIALTVVTIGVTKFFGNTKKEQELYSKKGVKDAKNKQ